MSSYTFEFHGETLQARPSGTLYWPAHKLLCVSDLHFGKAQRYATHGASALPPYETHDTLLRLDQDITATGAEKVVCLGDSFDRVEASQELDGRSKDWIARLQSGREWIWIEGNHDPGPIELSGSHLADLRLGSIAFRHIAQDGSSGEISGHYHPKISLQMKSRRITRRCFLMDTDRIIMPAFGTYTGGLDVTHAPLASLLKPDAICILSDGAKALPVPRPKA
ncbi:ligase-associated DNA damage response endonuclease PdeM [Planktotalea sp.]|uniref:ligase-associated DNA damage response endonuclease PdeM n=1 Tax=Planktotalea sp. TaxID=2029877 RepID=UPI00329A7BDB